MGSLESMCASCWRRRSSARQSWTRAVSTRCSGSETWCCCGPRSCSTPRRTLASYARGGNGPSRPALAPTPARSRSRGRCDAARRSTWPGSSPSTGRRASGSWPGFGPGAGGRARGVEVLLDRKEIRGVRHYPRAPGGAATLRRTTSGCGRRSRSTARRSTTPPPPA
jgi:hypothetical protein